MKPNFTVTHDRGREQIAFEIRKVARTERSLSPAAIENRIDHTLALHRRTRARTRCTLPSVASPEKDDDGQGDEKDAGDA